MMKLTQLQENAVNQILEKYKNKDKLVNFKAPTGCGKTFIVCNIISQIILQNHFQQTKTCIICATISDGELPNQMKLNFDEYQKYLMKDKGCEFITKYYQSPSSNNKYKFEYDSIINPIEDGVIIFGKSSFGKKRIFYEENTIGRLIQQIKKNNWKLIYIRDEAHLGGETIPKETIESKHFETLMNKEADFIIKMTATPKDDEQNLIEISLAKLKNPDDNKFLIKTTLSIDGSLNDEKGISKDDEIDDFDYFKSAINYFKNKIKPKYLSDQQLKNINPAVLVQIDNEPTNEDCKKQWKDLLLKIENYLKNVVNLEFAEYFSEKGKNQGEGRYHSLKEENTPFQLSKNTSQYSCIIFKVALAKGWNIPRACMIIQLRRWSSKALNTQTIGRIMRNPLKTLEYNKNALIYYVFSNYTKTKNYQKFVLNEKLKDLKFPQIKIKPHKDILDYKKIKKQLFNFFEKRKNEILQKYKNEIANKKSINIHVKYANCNQYVAYKIRTCFDLYEYINQIKQKNQSFWLHFDNFEQILMEIYKKNFKNHFSYLFYQLIIFSEEFMFINELKQKINNLKYQQMYINSDQYEYSEQKLLESFHQYISCDDQENEKDSIEIQDFSQLLYKPATNDNEKIYVDSKNEKFFLTKWRQFFSRNCSKEKDIFFWGKNPGNIKGNNLYFEYLDSDCQIHKAFLDMVIKCKNKFFFIEIKGEKDIEPLKTNDIEISMEKWSKKKTNFYFCIAYVNNNSYKISKIHSINKIENENYTFDKIKQLLIEQ